MIRTEYKDLINFNLKESILQKSENTAISLIKELKLLITKKKDSNSGFTIKPEHFRGPFRFFLEEFNELISEPNECVDEYEQRSNIIASVEHLNAEFSKMSAQLKLISQKAMQLSELHNKCDNIKYLCQRTTQEIKKLEEKMTKEEKSLFDLKEEQKNKVFRYRYYDIEHLKWNRSNSDTETRADALLSLNELDAVYLDQYELAIYDYNLVFKEALEVIQKFDANVKSVINYFALNYKKIIYNIMLSKKIVYSKELADFKNLKTRINKINFSRDCAEPFRHVGSLPSRTESDDLFLTSQQTQKFKSLDSSDQSIIHNYCLQIDNYIIHNLLDKAMVIINKALKENPNNPFLLYSKGYILYCWKLYEEALEFFNEAIKLRLCEEYLLYRVQVYVDLERWQDAINDLKVAIDSGSKNEELLKRRISQYEKKLKNKK